MLQDYRHVFGRYVLSRGNSSRIVYSAFRLHLNQDEKERNLVFYYYYGGYYYYYGGYYYYYNYYYFGYYDYYYYYTGGLAWNVITFAIVLPIVCCVGIIVTIICCKTGRCNRF